MAKQVASGSELDDQRFKVDDKTWQRWQYMGQDGRNCKNWQEMAEMVR